MTTKKPSRTPVSKGMNEKKIQDSKVLIVGFTVKFRKKRSTIVNLLLKLKLANRRRGPKLQTMEGHSPRTKFGNVPKKIVPKHLEAREECPCDLKHQH